MRMSPRPAGRVLFRGKRGFGGSTRYACSAAVVNAACCRRSVVAKARSLRLFPGCPAFFD